MVSAPLRGGGTERTYGPRLPAPGLRFGKAAVLRLREDRGRARPSVEANLGALRGHSGAWLAMGAHSLFVPRPCRVRTPFSYSNYLT